MRRHQRERHVLIGTAPPVVLAVHDPGLVRVQLQPQTGQPRIERGPHLAGLPLGRTMDHGVVGIPFERHGRELPRQEHVERLVQHQVGQHRGDR